MLSIHRGHSVRYLTDEVAKSRSYVDRVRRQEAAEATSTSVEVRP